MCICVRYDHAVNAVLFYVFTHFLFKIIAFSYVLSAKNKSKTEFNSINPNNRTERHKSGVGYIEHKQKSSP